MRTLPTLARSLVLIGAALCASAASAVELKGFRGLMWGDAPSYLGAAELVQAEGSVACYRRHNENMLFGDSPLAAVRYCFQRDRLFLVVLDSTVNLNSLLADFKSGYGAPDVQTAAYARWGAADANLIVDISTPAAGAAATMRIVASDYAR
jgi:hypothetical protein